jgi:hypothetical protein
MTCSCAIGVRLLSLLSPLNTDMQHGSQISKNNEFKNPNKVSLELQVWNYIILKEERTRETSKINIPKYDT